MTPKQAMELFTKKAGRMPTKEELQAIVQGHIKL